MDWALFLSAFLSSTLLPGGSEALLLLRLSEGASANTMILIATIGNVLGSLLTYGLGRLGNTSVHRRWLRISESHLHRAEQWFTRYGMPSLLLAWLPVVGDPLCLIAGVLRCRLMPFLLLVTVGKAARYTVISWVFL